MANMMGFRHPHLACFSSTSPSSRDCYTSTVMDVVLGFGRSDGRNKNSVHGNENSKIGRKSANYHPSIWGDHFIKSSPNDLKPDAKIQKRANELKEELKRMLGSVNDPLQEMNLINAIQRLGVAYHFEKEIENALLRMYNTYNDSSLNSNDLHAIVLRFRLLRQEGYNISSDVFNKLKDDKGSFKETLACDIRGLLCLYEAGYLGTFGEEILDEAISFGREQLNLALPHLKPPLSTLVELALELPLQRRVERLQTRYYISIYEIEEDRNDILLEFAKLDFNLLQLLHKNELKLLTKWWKDNDFSSKLPFIRDRVVECYFWILGVYFEPHYSRARMMVAKIIALTSIMDDIYDVYATIEELEQYTDAIERWDRRAGDQLPDYMKLHFLALLDVVDKFEEELAREGKSYRISYLKQALKELAKYYYIEAEWCNSGYEPKTMEEYMEVASVTSAYPMLVVVSYVGMGDIATKEAFDWIINKPNIIQSSAIICRFKDDVTSNELEQERGHVASAVQIYMKEHGVPYTEACEKLRAMSADAWKNLNKGLLKPIEAPAPLLHRILNFTRVIELLYQYKDSYTNSNKETKERIELVLVNSISI